jgi:DNA-binding transcriptional ArsR family regulator
LLFFNNSERSLMGMPSPRRDTRDQAALRALASPARQELVDILARLGPASAAALSRVIGRPADGLYYHLRELQRVGLVRRVPRRNGAGGPAASGRHAALFQTVQEEPAIRHDAAPGGNSPAVAAIVSSMLRIGIRDFRRAAAIPGVRTREPGRELWALRVTGWLAPNDLREVNRRMHALRQSAGRPGPGGKLYAVTILLAPLGRARKKQRRPRKAAR